MEMAGDVDGDGSDACVTDMSSMRHQSSGTLSLPRRDCDKARLGDS